MLAYDLPLVGGRISLSGLDTSDSARAETNQQGAFRLDGLESGNYRLELRGLRNSLQHARILELSSDREILIELERALLRGYVVQDFDESPVGGASVSLVLAEDGATSLDGARETTTDARGFFQFHNVPTGSWRLVARKAGWNQTEALVTMDGGTVDGVRLELASTEGLVLEVKDESGRPPSQVMITVYDSNGEVLSSETYRTGENGQIHLNMIPSGNWWSRVSAAGLKPVDQKIVVPGGTVRVVLSPLDSEQ